jgi:hypothetical protein
MDEDLKAKIRTRITELPEDVREAIQSNALGDHIRQIGQKHKLHIDQMETLSQETYLTMLAFSPASQFVNNIVEQVRVPRDKAEEIANDINNQIFLSIRESMKKFADEQALLAATPPLTTPTTPTPAPAATATPAPSAPLTPSATPKPPLASVLPTASTPTTPQAPVSPPFRVSPPPIKPIIPTPAAQPTPLQPPPVSKPALGTPDMHAAEVMLNEKTVEVAALSSPQATQGGAKGNPIYKKDPYREPVDDK